jgi:hypothetical protein
VADFAYGFLFLPAIQLLGAAVPEAYSTIDGASHDTILEEVKKILMLSPDQFRLLHQ